MSISELKLIREDYAWELVRVLDVNASNIYALITATPAQRAAALVSVLERVKAKEVAG